MFEIHVGSYLEMFTTMYGWTLYSMLFQLLSITGVIYYPFLKALYNVWKGVKDSRDSGDAAVVAQKQITYSVIAMLAVFSVCVLPAVQLQATDIAYNRSCVSGGVTQNIVDTDASQPTQYGNTLQPTQGQPGIPVFWWFLMAFSSGVNQATAASLPCLDDVRGLDGVLRGLTIQDPSLRGEYNRFANECFLPAKSRFFAALNGEMGPAFQQHTQNSFNAYLAAGGNEDDPLYIGSEFYLITPGYYDWGGNTSAGNMTPANCTAQIPNGYCSFQAKTDVPGWPYVEARDNYNQADINAGTPGRPYCDEWWSEFPNQNLTLKNKLLINVEASDTSVVDYQWDDSRSAMENIRAIAGNAWSALPGYDQNDIDEMIIKRYVRDNMPDMDESGTDDSINALWTTAGVAGAAVIGTRIPVVGKAIAGAGEEFASSLANVYISLWTLKQAAPKALAIILMMIYSLLIFYLVMSEYEIDSVITMMFIILALRFFTPLWVIADYLDESLFTSMYFHESDGAFNLQRAIDEVGTIMTMGTDRLILDMVLMAFYLLVPGLLLTIMGIAGVRTGNIVASMDGAGRQTNKFSGMGKSGMGKK